MGLVARHRLPHSRNFTSVLRESQTCNRMLVDGQRLLEELFDPSCRPSLRWLREQQRRRAIPFVKLGHLVFFDVDDVRHALAKNFTVRAVGQ